MRDKLAKTFIILVVLAAGVNGGGCPCTDKFMELFGITEAVKQIEKAYFKNDDIKFPLYGFYFNMVKELDLIAAIAKHDSIDLHSMWDPVVKKLTGKVSSSLKAI